ncbi:hypothetical protein [Curtobacterium sp. MCSS17_016]|uniref:hypothetical protein n=1 Tax=Curtobacterium sp. MCSS17_016 TaxID=2175644 RepID=UPI000DA73825|nr:hypothetical protein [Curtobacterium sp. MCSS17_016]WIE81399.1 hypothetical protein DEJ19_019380 [Curtobacterium sp. MCSS17_016]
MATDDPSLDDVEQTFRDNLEVPEGEYDEDGQQGLLDIIRVQDPERFERISDEFSVDKLFPPEQ